LRVFNALLNFDPYQWHKSSSFVGWDGDPHISRGGREVKQWKLNPLIKSGKRPKIRNARCCEGFPVYR
jgi:hypothetical protein